MNSFVNQTPYEVRIRVYHDEVEVLAGEPFRKGDDEDHRETESERGDEGDELEGLADYDLDVLLNEEVVDADLIASFIANVGLRRFSEYRRKRLKGQ